MVPFASPRHQDDLPAVDDRLVEPEQHAEVFDGVLVPVSPAHEPHGARHHLVSAILGSYLVPGFTVAIDMLTRVSTDSDVAPDISIYPLARDPVTGGRRLEHLVFEIVNTETRRHAGRRAAKLITRGVHRVFAIDVVRKQALEWSRVRRSWTELASDAVVEHPVFMEPVPMETLINAIVADNHIARALLVKRNPVLEAARALDREEGFRSGLQQGESKGLQQGRTEGLQQGRTEGLQQGRTEGLQQGRTEGLQQGKASSVIAILTARGWTLDDAMRARIKGERDLERLDRWVVLASSCASLADLFAEP